MPTQTAVPPERGAAAPVLFAVLKTIGRGVAHNPVIAGGVTAFAVSMMFFSSNAMWYQPHAQEHAFFRTRAVPFVERAGQAPAATGSIQSDDTGRVFAKAPANPAPAQDVPSGGAATAKVQKILARLHLYSGDIDGLSGPQTRTAIEAYQKIVGLEPTGEISDALLRQLDAPAQGSGLPPVPEPAPRGTTGKADVTANATHSPLIAETASNNPAQDKIIVKVQAGLRAFGNDQIQLDGTMGAQTRAAIREFQSLFGLPVTGEIDNRLVAKMEEVGLIGN